MQGSPILERCLAAYLHQSSRVWNHLPASLRLHRQGAAYGRHLNQLVRLHSDRRQSFGTFFLRNRAELELLRGLVNEKPQGSRLDMSVVACSKGAEVYSMAWVIRSARPDLQFNLHAVDISQEIVDFAARGIYSLADSDAIDPSNKEAAKRRGEVNWNTSRDQNASIFERMKKQEIDSMFDVQADQARIKPWLKEGINWLCCDANDSRLLELIGPQEVVIANRFLCHMKPADAQRCLYKLAQLVRPGGYLFVSGVDLDVRTTVARELGWRPVPDLLREIHDGDTSIRAGWPLHYWGLEPFDDHRSDWKIRYASVFQIGEAA